MMAMRMTIGTRLRQTQRITQSLRLSTRQRLQLQERILALRLELVGTLRDEVYQPRATCSNPSCARELTPMEIIRGFNQDPNDFTTCCPGCGERFEPRLICFDNIGGRVDLPFFCGSQTRALLAGKETLSPQELAREHPAIYRSAIAHWGGIRQAFELAGLHYEFEEIHDWRHKILPFLGRLPDTVIASCVHVSVATIRAIRKENGITRYTLRTTLEEVEVEI